MDPYEALGLDHSADPAALRRALRVRMRQLHPDLGASGDTADELRAVLEAYARLGGRPAQARADARWPAPHSNLRFYRRQRLGPALWAAFLRTLRRYSRPARVT